MCRNLFFFPLNWILEGFVWQGALQSAQVHILVRFGWELVSVVNKNVETTSSVHIVLLCLKGKVI